MARNAYIGTATILLYTAKGNVTGATCKIRIVKLSDGTKTVDDASMTEVSSTNAPGLYRYSWTPTAIGGYAAYLFQGTFASPTWLQKEEIEVLGATSAPPVGNYTTAALVASALQFEESGDTRLVFDTTSKPTLAEVNQWISEAEDLIDDETHHSWKATTVTDEHYDFEIAEESKSFFRPRRGSNADEKIVFLKHRQIRTLTTGSGDKLEVWDGSQWVDWIATGSAYTEGRDEDFWLDYDQGILYFANSYPSRKKNAVRMTYRYGASSVPGDITRLATTMVASQILQTDTSDLYVAGSETQKKEEVLKRWDDQIKRILNNRAEVRLL